MFPFSVHQTPDGLWSVATATMIVCHLADEMTAKELTAKTFDLPAALINEAFANPGSVLTWRATWQQAVAHELQTLSETVEDLTDATAEELADLQASVELLNEVTALQAREQRRAELLRELAAEAFRAGANQQQILSRLIKPHTPKHIRDAHASVAPTSRRIIEIQQELRDLE